MQEQMTLLRRTLIVLTARDMSATPCGLMEVSSVTNARRVVGLIEKQEGVATCTLN